MSRDKRTTAEKIEDASAALRPAPTTAEKSVARNRALPTVTTHPVVKTAQPQVNMVTYANARKFEVDAEKRLADGWELQGNTGPAAGRITASRLLLTGPLAFGLRKGKGKITVTWVKT